MKKILCTIITSLSLASVTGCEKDYYSNGCPTPETHTKKLEEKATGTYDPDYAISAIACVTEGCYTNCECKYGRLCVDEECTDNPETSSCNYNLELTCNPETNKWECK
jgi:hypothetical protein